MSSSFIRNQTITRSNKQIPSPKQTRFNTYKTPSKLSLSFKESNSINTKYRLRPKNDFNRYIDNQIKSLHTKHKEDAMYIKQLEQSKEALKKRNKEIQAELIIDKAYSLYKNNAIRSYDFNKNKVNTTPNGEVLLPKISVAKMKEKLIEEAERLFPEHYYDTLNTDTNDNKGKGNRNEIVMKEVYYDTEITNSNNNITLDTPKEFQLKYLKGTSEQSKTNKKYEEKYKADYDKYHVVTVKLNLNKKKKAFPASSK